MTKFIELEAIERIAEDIISYWADHKSSYDYLTEVRMINLGDSYEFKSNKGILNLYTGARFIDVDSTVSSDLITLDKGIVIGNSLVNAIEKNIDEKIKASNHSGKLSDMKEVVKIVIDNSVSITEDNKVCLKYAVEVIY